MYNVGNRIITLRSRKMLDLKRIQENKEKIEELLARKGCKADFTAIIKADETRRDRQKNDENRRDRKKNYCEKDCG